jgi:6-phosphogluconolactonase (cycloisomerase 2 family)
LTQTSTFNTSTRKPSWLELNRQNNVLYMIDEAINGANGTVVSYKTSFTGHLTEIQRVEAMAGGAHAAFYGSGSALAVPH